MTPLRQQMIDAMRQRGYSRRTHQSYLGAVSGLARYTYRIAISNGRLLAMDKDWVRFRYKDYRDNQSKVMALDCTEFIRRFLMHVLPRGLMRIRHYGILANRCRKKALKIVRKALATTAPEKADSATSEAISHPCPKCRKGQLRFKHKIDPIKVSGHPLPS